MDINPGKLELLIRRHRPELNGIISFERITTGKFNTSFFVKTEDEELVLRIAPPRDAVFVFYEREMMRQEPEIHALVLSQTSVPVARIVAFGSDVPQIVDVPNLQLSISGWLLIAKHEGR